jgi:hypothetical protein
MVEHSFTSSDNDDGYTSSEDSFLLTSKSRDKGKYVPELAGGNHPSPIGLQNAGILPHVPVGEPARSV